MMDQLEKLSKGYFKCLEESISTLPQEEQGKIFRPCAIQCVKDTVLVEQRRMFEACHRDMDEFYGTDAESEYYFGSVIEPGHIYEFGYPRCLCYMHEAGYDLAPVHCECSRQSILYVLQELMPEKSFQVEKIETVLDGADKCRFRIIME